MYDPWPEFRRFALVFIGMTFVAIVVIALVLPMVER